MFVSNPFGVIVIVLFIVDIKPATTKLLIIFFTVSTSKPKIFAAFSGVVSGAPFNKSNTCFSVSVTNLCFANSKLNASALLPNVTNSSLTIGSSLSSIALPSNKDKT